MENKIKVTTASDAVRKQLAVYEATGRFPKHCDAEQARLVGKYAASMKAYNNADAVRWYIVDNQHEGDPNVLIEYVLKKLVNMCYDLQCDIDYFKKEIGRLGKEKYEERYANKASSTDGHGNLIEWGWQEADKINAAEIEAIVHYIVKNKGKVDDAELIAKIVDKLMQMKDILAREQTHLENGTDSNK